MSKEIETPQPGQQPRPCPQDCSKCSMPQQVYCTSKMLFDLSRAYQEQRQQLASVVSAVAAIREQLKPTAATDQLSIPFSTQE